MSRAGTGPDMQNDDILGRAAVPRFQQLQFATTFIREEELAPPET